jgi:hypothetical protein
MSTKKLRIWWMPQAPMKAFYVPVRSLEEAALVQDTLALYDLFQYDNKVKPDYANMGGLQEFDEEEQDWVDWYDEETGDDFDTYCIENGLSRCTEIRNANQTKG